MTPEQVELVQSSYASLGPDATAMAREFYRRLFEADPSAEALFTDGPDVMADKFARELDAVVQAITRFDDFAARVTDLATRHAGYGVETRHYRAAGEALVGALALQLGPAWDPRLEAAWRRAYNLVAEIMMATATEVGRGRARPAGRTVGEAR
jgi:hemoglobin-like flavoprotein